MKVFQAKLLEILLYQKMINPTYLYCTSESCILCHPAELPMNFQLLSV